MDIRTGLEWIAAHVRQVGPLGRGVARVGLSDRAASVAARTNLAQRAGPLVRRMVHAGARTALALLPARAVQDAASRRDERARLMAALALAVPLAAVVLAYALATTVPVPSGGARQGPSDRPAEPSHLGDPGDLAALDDLEADADRRAESAELATGADLLSGPVDPSAGADPAIRSEDLSTHTVRLAGIRALARLDGAAGQERQVIAIDGEVYVLNRATGRLDRVTEGTPQVVLEPGQLIDGQTVRQPVALFRLPGANATPDRPVVLDSANRLWWVDSGSISPLGLPGEPAWRSVEVLTGYEGRLYVVDSVAGQIWRYDTATPSGQAAAGDAVGFASAAAWLSEAEELAGAIDVAIDGRLYLLFEDGLIAKYEGGRRVDFGPVNVPGDLARPSGLYTSPTAGRILVGDRGNGRVLVLSPTGEFVGQLLRPRAPAAADPLDASGRFRDLHDIDWDENRSALYVVSGTTVYVAPYGAPSGRRGP